MGFKADPLYSRLLIKTVKTLPDHNDKRCIHLAEEATQEFYTLLQRTREEEPKQTKEENMDQFDRVWETFMSDYQIKLLQGL